MIHGRQSLPQTGGILLAVALLCVALGGCATRLPRAARSSFRDCAHCPLMVVVPAGSFEMGSDAAEHAREAIPQTMALSESPMHTVTIGRAFAVGRFEVTRGEYAAFVAARPRDGAEAGCTVIDPATGRWNLEPARSWRDPGYPQSDRHPAVCMSFADAEAYVEWLTSTTGHRYRLLAEAEWEYAARAGVHSTRFWGDGRDDACQHANVADLTRAEVQRVPEPTPELVFQCRDGYVATAPVGSFTPNAFGLYDVNGNVWEWTADCFNPDYSGAPTDGSARRDGDCTRHMDRGGSWVNSPKYLRLAVRHADVASIRNDVLGLRVARELDAEEMP